jgi:hypothetical protein
MGACCGVLVWAGLAAAAPTAPVPPTLEIEVLDPNVDPVGNPAVIPTIGPDGLTRVDIPRTVLVHRYYYSGDRSFQAQMLPGGPCVVVVNHPKTGERLYIPVQMIPGAPRVTYTGNSIEYDFHTQAVTITFCCWLSDRPKVEYRTGVPVARRVGAAVAVVGKAGREFIDRTGLPEAKDKVCDGAKNVVETVADRTQDLGTAVVTPVVQAVQFIPGVKLLTSPPEQRAERLRDAEVKRAAAKAKQEAAVFIGTNH